MVQMHTAPAPTDLQGARRSRWPLVAAAAGVLGLAGSASQGLDGEVAQRGDAALGTATALLLLLVAALWRRLVEPRTRSSTAAHAVSLALVASAAGLAVGGLEGAGGWLGVAAAAAAVAWMGLRERTVTRAVAAVSLLAVLTVPVVPGLAGPAWLVVTGAMLAYGRSTIAR